MADDLIAALREGKVAVARSIVRDDPMAARHARAIVIVAFAKLAPILAAAR